MPQYRKRPEIVDAIQFTGDNRDEIISFIGGAMNGDVGDWYIKQANGFLLVMDPAAFAATYEVPVAVTDGPAPSTL